jgi:hypothetical protein
LADGLRSLIEAAVTPEVGTEGRLVVTKERLSGALACPAHHPGPGYGEREPNLPLACGALVGALFRQLVTVGSIGDPMRDGMAALALDDRQASLLSSIERLTAGARDELRAEVERQAGGLSRRWPVFEPSWLPRTDEAMQVPLAEGAVVLSTRVDLAVGRPAEHEASVAIVELATGARRTAHRVDRHFAALVETLRHAAPPFVAATYYASSGELDVEPVGEELLTAAARRVAAGVRALAGLAEAHLPGSALVPLCAACAASPGDASRQAPGPFRGEQPSASEC